MPLVLQWLCFLRDRTLKHLKRNSSDLFPVNSHLIPVSPEFNFVCRKQRVDHDVGGRFLGFKNKRRDESFFCLSRSLIGVPDGPCRTRLTVCLTGEVSAKDFLKHSTATNGATACASLGKSLGNGCT